MVFALLLTGCSGDVSDDQKKLQKQNQKTKLRL